MITLLRTFRGYSVTLFMSMTVASVIAVLGLFDKRGSVFWPLVRLWGFAVRKAGGVRQLEVIGREFIPADTGVILMPNHESHLDPPLMMDLSPVPVRFIAKASLFRIPFLGWAMWSAGMVPIDRSNQQKAFASIARATAMIKAGKNILVFPEGTRTPDGEMKPFKKGGFVMAVRGGVPIVPVGIAGTRRIMPPGLMIENSGSAVVVLGAPIDTTGYDEDSKAALMDLVYERIAELREEAHLRLEAMS
jgi:1-acyl-sn-glycerol-3-phosphate acyltransferase